MMSRAIGLKESRSNIARKMIIRPIVSLLPIPSRPHCCSKRVYYQTRQDTVTHRSTPSSSFRPHIPVGASTPNPDPHLHIHFTQPYVSITPSLHPFPAFSAKNLTSTSSSCANFSKFGITSSLTSCSPFALPVYSPAATPSFSIWLMVAVGESGSRLKMSMSTA